MNINNLKENLKRVISLRDEIMDLKKENRRTYSLREYVDLFRDMLIHTDHGERDKFWWPMHIALSKLDELADIEEEKIQISIFGKQKKAFITYKSIHKGYAARISATRNRMKFAARLIWNGFAIHSLPKTAIPLVKKIIIW